MSQELDERLRSALHTHVDRATRQVRQPSTATIAAGAARKRRRQRIELAAVSLVLAVVVGIVGTSAIGSESTPSVADGGPVPTSTAVVPASTTTFPSASTSTVAQAPPMTTPPGEAPIWFELDAGVALAWAAESDGSTRYWTRTPQMTAEAGPKEGTVDSLVIPLDRTTALIVVFRSPGGPQPDAVSVAVPGGDVQQVEIAWRSDIDLATARVALPSPDVDIDQIVVTVG